MYNYSSSDNSKLLNVLSLAQCTALPILPEETWPSPLSHTASCCCPPFLWLEDKELFLLQRSSSVPDLEQGFKSLYLSLQVAEPAQNSSSCLGCVQEQTDEWTTFHNWLHSYKCPGARHSFNPWFWYPFLWQKNSVKYRPSHLNALHLPKIPKPKYPAQIWVCPDEIAQITSNHCIPAPESPAQIKLNCFNCRNKQDLRKYKYYWLLFGCHTCSTRCKTWNQIYVPSINPGFPCWYLKLKSVTTSVTVALQETWFGPFCIYSHIQTF